MTPQHFAPRARINVGLAGRLVDRGHLVADRLSGLAKIAEGPPAALRHRTLHRALVPQREPPMIEGAHDAPFVAEPNEAAPPIVERIGAPRQLRDRLLVVR